MSGPCLVNVRKDTTLRNVCDAGDDDRFVQDNSDDNDNEGEETGDGATARDRRGLPGSPPGEPGRRAGQVHLERHIFMGNSGQSLDLDAARAKLFGSAALASATCEQEGVPAPVALARQDLGVAPERAQSGQEK